MKTLMRKTPASLIAGLLSMTAACLVAEDDVNVLFFLVDDLRPDLGCYGETQMKTPSIDKLASEGVLFERAYCQQAICGPSRISMMAGMYPYRLGIQDLWSPLRENIPDAMSLPRYFKAAGYKTLSFGKVYHHHGDDRANWTELPEKPGSLYASPEVLESIRKRTEAAEKKGLSVKEKFAVTRGPPTEMVVVEDHVYQDGAVAQQAIEALRRHQDEPFFMCVGFAKPHLPFAAPKRYWDLYEREDFEVPERSLPVDAPKIAFTRWGELRAYQGMPKEGVLDDAQTRALRHGYAASVSYMDAQLGKVMTELERLGLREKTIVVMWGDHGYKLGEHAQWCKHTNFELDARVPLLVSAPGIAFGQRSGALVESIDIFPTLAALSGGEIPGGLDGRSLEPVLREPERAFRDFALSEYRRGSVIGFSMRTHRWRYTEWIHTETGEILQRELYDHGTTQLSPHNLAEEPGMADRVAQFSSRLNAAARLQEKPLSSKQ